MEDASGEIVDDRQSMGVPVRADYISRGFPVGLALRGTALELVLLAGSKDPILGRNPFPPVGTGRGDNLAFACVGSGWHPPHEMRVGEPMASRGSGISDSCHKRSTRVRRPSGSIR
jgi:hypothetical protein